MAADTSTLFAEATRLAKAGQKTEALTLLHRLLIQDPTHVPALMYLSWLTPDIHEGIAALEKVTTFNVEASVLARAQQGLTELRAKAAASVTAVPTSPAPAETVAPAASQPATPPEPTSAPDPVAQARAVVWPFRKLNRPIGELLDEGKIAISDLQWAAGNDRRVSDQVRAAAKTLLSDVPKPAETVADINWTEAVQTARQVIWPYRRLHRPMGELLDQGKITAKDLEYAVRRAPGPVRLAAQILLKAQPPSSTSTPAANEPSTEMTLAEARQVIWPYRKLNRPMGDLLTEGKITTKDLQYAIDRAKPEVAEAAQLLLDQVSTEAAIQAEETGKLTEPAPAAPPMIVPRGDGTLVVVGSSDYLKQNQFIGRLKVLAGALFSDSLFEEGLDQYTTHKRGERGEEDVVRELKKLLDSRWKLYRNLTLPDSDADLDAVLVGPTGVLSFEIKAFTGSFRVRGSEWSYRQGAQWRLMDKNPTKQAQWNRQRLAHYLQDRLSDDLTVGAMIVLGREPQYIKLVQPTIYVVHLNKLADGLKPYFAQPLLSDKTLKTIGEVLDKLV